MTTVQTDDYYICLLYFRFDEWNRSGVAAAAIGRSRRGAVPRIERKWKSKKENEYIDTRRRRVLNNDDYTIYTVTTTMWTKP